MPVQIKKYNDTRLVKFIFLMTLYFLILPPLLLILPPLPLHRTLPSQRGRSWGDVRDHGRVRSSWGSWPSPRSWEACHGLAWQGRQLPRQRRGHRSSPSWQRARPFRRVRASWGSRRQLFLPCLRFLLLLEQRNKWKRNGTLQSGMLMT